MCVFPKHLLFLFLPSFQRMETVWPKNYQQTKARKKVGEGARKSTLHS